MKARGLSVVIVAATLSCAAVAVAQEPDPADEPEAAPAGEEPPPESGAPPGDAPPVEAAPGPPASAAAPPDDTHFGFAGQITISDDLQMAATRVSTAGQSGSFTEIQLRPALDFFPIPNLSIGGQLIIGYNSFDDVGGSSSSTELGLLVRVGYNVSISDSVSIWPRLSVGYDHLGGDQGVGSLDSIPIDVFVPMVVQLASHFFIGGGPWYATTLLSQRESFDEPRISKLGLRATVGGYFRGL